MNKKLRKKIGFIIHPLDVSSFLETFPYFYKKLNFFIGSFLKIENAFEIVNAFSKMPSHKIFKVKDLKIYNYSVDLVCVMCPMFPKEMLTNKSKLLQKMKQAIAIFKKEKVDIITLAAFSSIATNGGKDLSKFTKIPITSGNALTASLCVDFIRYSVKKFYGAAKDLTLSVVGATGDIGSVCALEMADDFNKIILCSRTISTNSDIVKRMASKNIELQQDVKCAVKDADVVLTAASTIGTLLSADDFKNGAVVCDVGMPPNVGRMILKQRKDVKVFNGGRGSSEFYDKINNKKWQALFPRNSIFGCFLEAFVIALSERFDLISMGKGEISVGKIRDFKNLSDSLKISFSKDCEIIYDA